MAKLIHSKESQALLAELELTEKDVPGIEGIAIDPEDESMLVIWASASRTNDGYLPKLLKHAKFAVAMPYGTDINYWFRR